MKKLITILLTTTLLFSFTGCSSKPSDAKIKEALTEGTITFEDAKEKGWIDDEWIKKNIEIIKGNSKIYLFEPFETTYLDGKPAPKNIIEGEMCLVFFDINSEAAMKQLEAFNEVHDHFKSKGIPILGVLKNENTDAVKEKLSKFKFPIIIFNEAMQKSFTPFEGTTSRDVTSVFTKDGGIYSAWQTTVTAEELLKTSEVYGDGKK